MPDGGFGFAAGPSPHARVVSPLPPAGFSRASGVTLAVTACAVLRGSGRQGASGCFGTFVSDGDASRTIGVRLADVGGGGCSIATCRPLLYAGALKGQKSPAVAEAEFQQLGGARRNRRVGAGAVSGCAFAGGCTCRETSGVCVTTLPGACGLGGGPGRSTSTTSLLQHICALLFLCFSKSFRGVAERSASVWAAEAMPRRGGRGPPCDPLRPGRRPARLQFFFLSPSAVWRSGPRAWEKPWEHLEKTWRARPPSSPHSPTRGSTSWLGGGGGAACAVIFQRWGGDRGQVTGPPFSEVGPVGGQSPLSCPVFSAARAGGFVPAGVC